MTDWLKPGEYIDEHHILHTKKGHNICLKPIHSKLSDLDKEFDRGDYGVNKGTYCAAFVYDKSEKGCHIELLNGSSTANCYMNIPAQIGDYLKIWINQQYHGAYFSEAKLIEILK
jgi:hypothetical protein